MVLETVAGQAEALTNPRIERVARTLARQFVNTGVDRTQETSWAGLEQKPPARANRFGDVLRPRWTVPPAEQKDPDRGYPNAQNPARTHRKGRAVA